MSAPPPSSQPPASSSRAVRAPRRPEAGEAQNDLGTQTAEPGQSANFDDVMLAMDIVDTLRHRTLIAKRELATDEREQALIERLREIYHAQGIDVPDHILKDGVNALEEKRFVYTPKLLGLQGRLARLYISRDRWLKPLAMLVAASLAITAVYEFGVDAPRQRAAARLHQELSVTLPENLGNARAAALEIAATEYARRRIETTYQDGISAIAEDDAKGARASIDKVLVLQRDLERDLTIRVVSRPGERSGIFRIPNDMPDQRNYYLIVEAVDASGRPASLEIASEEDQSFGRTRKWAVRVPEGEYNRIAADKQDDQIIQNSVIGRKPRGQLAPSYTIPTAGGAIREW